MSNKPPYLDLTQATSPSKILPCKPSLSSHAAWNGIILRQYSQLPPHGFPEYCRLQHLIIIHQAAAFTWMADIGKRHVHGFVCPTFEEAIRNNPFQE